MREKIEQNRKHMCKLQKVPAYPKRFMEEGSQDAWEGTLTMAIFKSFVIYRQLLFHSDAETEAREEQERSPGVDWEECWLYQ